MGFLVGEWQKHRWCGSGPLLLSFSAPRFPSAVENERMTMPSHRSDPNADGCVEKLIETLKSGKTWDRLTAPMALVNFASSDERVVTALREALRDPARIVRVRAAEALWAVTGETTDAVPVFIEALRSGETLERLNILSFLGKRGRSAQTAVPRVKLLLQDLSSRVRDAAWNTLLKINDLEESPDGIAGLLADGDAYVRFQAAVTLVEMNQHVDQAEKELIRALGHEDESIRQRAASVLRELEDSSEEVVTALIGALKDPEPGVRRVAAKSLGKIGLRSTEALEALRTRLDDVEVLVRVEAARALSRLGVQTREVALVLGEAALNRAISARLNAIKALSDMGPAAEPAVGHLMVALIDDDDLVGRAAVDAIEKLGPEAKQAVPVLEWLVEDRDPAIRESVKRILKKRILRAVRK